MKKPLTFLISMLATIVNAQVKISGIAKNYTDTIFYIREPGGFQNFTRAWRDRMVKVTINKEGEFKALIPEQSINTWYIKTDNGNQFFDLIKGRSLTLIADFSQSNPLRAINANADDFNFLSSSYANDSINNYYKDKEFLINSRSKNIDSALFYRKGLANYKLNLLNKYRNSHTLSEIYYNWLRSNYTYEPYERTIVLNIKKDSIDDVTVAKIVEKGVHDDYAALNISNYNDIIDFYIQNKFKKQNKGEFSINEYFDFVVNGNLINGNTRDVFLSRFMYWIRTSPDSLYTPIFKKYDKIVLNKEMKKMVNEARNDNRSPSISKIPDFSRAKSLEEIFKKYKGKVIYLDFWASWCIPCRQEMPNATLLKSKLTGKNIVFIYLGYNDKEKAWMKARNLLNIEGEHYLLNDKMIKEADELFGINGIPHYVIIDKEGRIINKHADGPSHVYKQLLELTEK